jgi:AAA+ ATPase superfamily predicted ATPase
MFIGRTEELALLEEYQESDEFEFLILYGRRRVGKTEMLSEFASRHRDRTLFFAAQQKNDPLNREDFSKLVQNHFGSYIAPFPNWEEAFQYYGKQAGDSRSILIIDEFPYLAEECPSIMSILQHLIDHEWKDSKIFLILCGSNISFMEQKVVGSSSPLYGRTTHQLELRSFDYYGAREFFPDYSEENQLLAYGILGGIPRYLNAFDDALSIQKNIERSILRNGAFLKEEPMILLDMETRQTAVYNSILAAISEGINRPAGIAQRIHEDKTKISKYMITLQNLRLIQKAVPCGEPDTSKKSIYRISDPFFRFWYRFEFSGRNHYEMLGPEAASKEIMSSMPDYMGLEFEDICREYMLREARLGKLPFVPYYLSKWWGNNPALKAEDDVDLLALSKDQKQGIFCECKFKSRPFAMEDYDDVVSSFHAFPKTETHYLYFFSKSGFTSSVERRAAEDHAVLISIKDLFLL